jgi:ATP-dependent Clp protease ATP-binding subunit ClpA
MGARPLRRVIQQKVEDPLSDAVLSGQFQPGDEVVVDVEVREDETDIILRSNPPESTPDAAESEEVTLA